MHFRRHMARNNGYKAQEIGLVMYHNNQINIVLCNNNIVAR